MGRIHNFLGLTVGLIVPDKQHDRRRRSGPSTPPTSPTAPTTSSASTTCATTWSRAQAQQDPAGPRLRHRRRGRLDPHRRGPHAADHLAAGSPTPPSSTTSSPSIVRGLAARRRLRGRRGEAHRRSHSRRASSRSSRRSASRTSTTASPRTSCTSSRRRCKAKELYKRDKDYVVTDGEVKIVDEFTGRILEGRRWSEGLHQAVEAKEGVQDQGGEPDPRHDHAPELLPPLREARRHDRHGRHRGRRVRQHLQPRRSCRSRPTSR